MISKKIKFLDQQAMDSKIIEHEIFFFIKYRMTIFINNGEKILFIQTAYKNNA